MMPGRRDDDAAPAIVALCLLLLEQVEHLGRRVCLSSGAMAQTFSDYAIHRNASLFAVDRVGTGRMMPVRY